MSLTLGSNIASLKIQRRLAESSNALSRASEHLASGQRINRASDDAAGLAIASTLRANERVFGQAARNVNDGISAINTAEGALTQLQLILQRQKELAEQSANGVYSATQRTALQTESTALTNEYNRIVAATKFNRVSLLDGTGGTIQLQAGTGASDTLTVDVATALGASSSSSSTGVTTSLGTGQVVTVDFTSTTGSYSSFLMQAPQGWQLHTGEVLNFNSVADGAYGSNFYFWFNVDGSDPTDPGTGTGVPLDVINISSAWDETQVQQAIDAVVSGYTGDVFSISNSGSSSTYTSLTHTNGPISATSDSDKMAFSTLQSGGADPDNDNAFNLYTSSGLVYQFWLHNNATGNGAACGASDFNFGANIGATVSETMLAVQSLVNATGVFSAAVQGTSLVISNINSGVASAPVSVGGGVYSPVVSSAGTAGNINTAADTLTITSHGLSTAQAVQVTSSAYMPGGLTSGNTYYVIKTDNNTIKLATSSANALSGTAINLTSNGSGTLSLSTGSSTTTTSAYMSQLDITTAAGARTALDTLATQTQKVTDALSSVGSLQSRLATRLSTLSTLRDANIAAASRITDVDVASETAAMVRQQIKQQAATSVLAQANQAPALVLSLLR